MINWPLVGTGGFPGPDLKTWFGRAAERLTILFFVFLVGFTAAPGFFRASPIAPGVSPAGERQVDHFAAQRQLVAEQRQLLAGRRFEFAAQGHL